MISGGPYHNFEIGWAVLATRKGTWSSRAHHYDASDEDAVRALCGKHIVALTDCLIFYPGNFLRCAHCQKIFDKRWH